MTSYPLDESSYKLLEHIGGGATAEVYAAKCVATDELVAIKRIDLEARAIEIDTLRAEIAFWQSCDHANVVRYLGSFVNHSVLHILMEFMNGGSCLDLLKNSYRKGIRKEAIIATILGAVLRALIYFHDHRRIHRDVKPGNILVNDRGEVKIADFGISANLVEQGQRKRARYTVIGTPCYMAPEVLTPSHGYTEKADIWSLGITAIELATGSAPYANLHPLDVVVKISTSPPPTLPENIHFSSAFREFVRLCLQTAPGKRPSAAELLESRFIRQRMTTVELAAELEGCIHEVSASAPVDPDMKSEARPTTEWDFEGLSVPPVDPDIKCEARTTTEWDFEGLSAPPEKKEAVEIKQVPSEVVKKGRFTITQVQPAKDASPEAARIAELEEEVASLRGRLVELQSEHEQLKARALELRVEMKQLQQTSSQRPSTDD
jgi:serine/threonine-protein kinase OSR1/STK39